MPLVGELAALGAALVWSSSISGFSHFGQRHSALYLTTLKGCVAVLFLLAAWWLSGVAAPSAWQCGMLVMSGLLGVAVGEPTFFLALQRLGAELPTTMMCLVPVLVTALGAITLGERANWGQIVGIVVVCTAVAALLWRPRTVTPSEGHGVVAAPLQPSGVIAARRAGVGYALLSVMAQAAGALLARRGLAGASMLPATLLRLGPATAAVGVVALLGRWLRPRRGVLAALRRPGEPAPVARSARAQWERHRTRALPPLLVFSFLGSFVGYLLEGSALKYASSIGVASALTFTYPVFTVVVSALITRRRIPRRQLGLALTAVGGVALIVF